MNPIPGIWNPGRGIQNPRLSWIPLYRVTLPLACSPTPLPRKKKKRKKGKKTLGVDAVVVVFFRVQGKLR